MASKFTVYLAISLLCGSLFGCHQQTRITPTQQIDQRQVAAIVTGALAGDGHYSAIVNAEGGLQIWDITNAKPIKEWHLSAQHDQIQHLALSDNGRYMVSASPHGLLYWDLHKNKPWVRWSLPGSVVTALTLSGDGKTVLAGFMNGDVLLMDLAKGHRLALQRHQGKILDVALSQDGQLALSGATDHTAKLWHTQTGEVQYQFQHQHRVTQVALSQDGHLAFTADALDEQRIWHTDSGQLHSQLRYIERWQLFNTARFSQDNQHLITGDAAKQVRIWDTQTGQLLKNWQVSAAQTRGGVIDISETPSRDWVSLNADALVEVWRL